MTQFTVTIEAPELAKAINHLADATALASMPAAINQLADAIAYASKPQDYAESLADAAARADQTSPAGSFDGAFAGTLAAPSPVAESVSAISTEAAATAPTPAPVAQATPTAAAPVPTEKTYTLDELSVASAELIDNGKMSQIMTIIQKYGVKAINLLRPDQYAAYAADIRAIGAKI